MVRLIMPDELPEWVPGDLTVDSASLGWDGVRIRGYRYAPSDVPVPAMQDYMIVVYRDGLTPMNRRCNAQWRSEHVSAGHVSLLTHAAQSHWRWSEPIEVSHMYLSPGAVANVAADVFERHIEDVELFDVLKVEDPLMAGIAMSLDFEARQGGLGGRLYVDALRTQASIHILRNYADVVFRMPNSNGGMTRIQRRDVIQYIEANIERNLSLEELARIAHLSTFHFVRKFKNEFGLPPHAYVIRHRLESAKKLLARSDRALKEIAAECGFADQSHMTRLFKRVLNATPSEFRKERRSMPPG